ncbi:MAG: DMT family transporter [[Clostridium] fimetarium]|nr:DMT family transporter [Alistipes timonensis]MCM1404838.1 DMT family transporter [[Clostridium] fimetarium]
MKLKGYLLAALAAAAYGTNPAFAVPLYAEGMNPNSVLLFRYLLGMPLLGLMVVGRGHSLRLNKGEWGQVALLGILMALSSLGLFESYKYMNSGIASTLLFVYPVMVAVIMVLFFHERFKASTAVCLALMAVGLSLLTHAGDGGEVSPYGCLLVMVSALTYALYIVIVNVNRHIKGIPTSKLLFYLLGFGSLLFAAMIPLGSPLTLPPSGGAWLNLLALAVIPTVLSLACTTVAIQAIGSTPTAIFGALEPVTAVVLSVAFLGQSITAREIIGGALIVAATTIVVAGGPVDKVILRIRKLFPRRERH